MPENDIKTKAEQLTAECAAAKAEAAAAKADVAALKADVEAKAAKIDEQKTSIDNLDKSVKEQKASIDDLKKKLAERPADFKRDFREAFYAQKDAIVKLVNEKKDKFDIKVELKTVTNIGTNHISPNNFLGVAVDTTIQAAVPVANAFLLVFGLRPRTANKLGWIEATSESGADYVAELATNTAASDVDFVEKTRSFGKICTKMTISTEVEDWFDQIYNYCVNEGARLVDAKIDAEIYGGAGSDASYPNKVYGLKGAATAFSALAAHAVERANAADVIFDAADQIAKEGYHASHAFVTWAILREIKSLKDANGNYLYNQITGMLDGIRILPSTRLSAGEMLIVDSNCSEAFGGNGYELEFIRNGAIDAYDVFFRKAVQVKTATPKKKGLIYVASVTTAIAALQVVSPEPESGSGGSGASV